MERRRNRNTILMKHQVKHNYPTTIDIFLSVIDNFGDIGFAVELIAGIEREYPWLYEFVIWTDSVDMVRGFALQNQDILGKYHVEHIGDFGVMRLSYLALSLFHAPIPDARFFSPRSLVLRIDYLSWDPTWVRHNCSEHIDSTWDRQIIEIIPSPLPRWGGLIPAYPASLSGTDLAERYGIDSDKKWISIFVYADTLIHSLILDSIPEDFEVLLFGHFDMILPVEYHIMPWVDIATWHACIDASEWVIARGEVSAMAALVRGKLAFWDMYKEIGGFPTSQSEDFLSCMHTDELYRDFHLRLNCQKSTPVYLSELITYQQMHTPNTLRTQNLITEIKKCIDSHEFSI
jgi:hypothetical protein